VLLLTIIFYRIQSNKRISCHQLLVDHEISGNLRGLLERGVQVAKDAEETANDFVMMSVGYAGAVGTCLWIEIKEDRAKVVWLSSSIMTILIPDVD
jgi:hypothetical protein